MSNSASTCTLLKSSWKYQTREFFDNSTLHGVRYIAEEGRPLREKLLWFCILLASIITTGVIIVNLWEKFQTSPTITGLDTDFHSWEVPFPSVTICEERPVNPDLAYDYIDQKWGNVSDEEREYFMSFFNTIASLSFQTMHKIKNFTTDSRLPSSNYRELILSLVYHCEDFMFDCHFKNMPYNCCHEFFPVFTQNGFCYIFNSKHHEPTWPWLNFPILDLPEKFILETDSKWSIIFTSKHLDQSTNIYLTSADTLPMGFERAQLEWDRRFFWAGFEVKHTYTTEDARQLTISQRHCVFADERPLLLNKNYSFRACASECHMRQAYELCSCVPHFYPLIESFKYCTLEELTCIAENVKKIKPVKHCGCELGCTNTLYEVDRLIENNTNTATKFAPVDAMSTLEIAFVSWPMIRYKREVIFGWVDLLVSLGGIAGLFLGFSLLSGVEIIYYFTIRACCMVYRNKDELEEYAKEVKVAEKVAQNETKDDKLFYKKDMEPFFVKPPPYSSLQHSIKRNKIGMISTEQIRNNRKIIWDQPKAPFGIEFLN